MAGGSGTGTCAVAIEQTVRITAVSKAEKIAFNINPGKLF
jgi:hypothetical protein